MIHSGQVEQYENCLIMNPGSATGAYSMFENDVVPSFALMDINGSKVRYCRVNGTSLLGL